MFENISQKEIINRTSIYIYTKKKYRSKFYISATPPLSNSVKRSFYSTSTPFFSPLSENPRLQKGKLEATQRVVVPLNFLEGRGDIRACPRREGFSCLFGGKHGSVTAIKVPRVNEIALSLYPGRACLSGVTVFRSCEKLTGTQAARSAISPRRRADTRC